MATIQTPEFRVSYPNVFTAKRNDLNGKDEFSLVALFPKGADLSALKKAAQEALAQKFGADKSKWPANIRSPFRDQGEKAKTVNGQRVLPNGMEEGAIFMNLRSNQRPGVVNQAVEDIIDQSEFYGGCWARASVAPYAYDMKGNRGVAFGLRNLQKVKDGDSFGSKTKPQEDFEPIAAATGAEAGTANASSIFD